MKALFKEKLLELVSKNGKADTDNVKILAAVSGGADSMCMAALLKDCEFNFSIAHVNFGLRGEESDGDEALVREWCQCNNIEFLVFKPDTKSYARENSLSTQVAARDLRYKWFYDVAVEQNFDFIAVAHNLNDSVETLFINLIRGTGLRGLTGISEINDKIVRPLIGFSREEILTYCNNHLIPFREDSSNRENHYTRNKIRNQIFPILKTINPHFLRTIERDMKIISSVYGIIDENREEVIKRVVKVSDEREIKSHFLPVAEIDIDQLRKEKFSDFWLYEILSEYGFNSSQTQDIYLSLTGQVGKKFDSESYTVVKDRTSLIVYKMSKNITQNSSSIVDGESEISVSGVTLRFRVFKREAGFNLKSTGNLHFLDADKASFPLEIRNKWDGDRFCPLGMENFKKISDFLIDEKVDLISKKNVKVITKNGQIVCLPGFRIDNRFKISDETVNILEISIC